MNPISKPMVPPFVLTVALCRAAPPAARRRPGGRRVRGHRAEWRERRGVGPAPWVKMNNSSNILLIGVVILTYEL